MGSIFDPKINTPKKLMIKTRNSNSPLFEIFNTFIKRDNSLIVAGDRYNNTPQTNQ